MVPRSHLFLDGADFTVHEQAHQVQVLACPADRHPSPPASWSDSGSSFQAGLCLVIMKVGVGRYT